MHYSRAKLPASLRNQSIFALQARLSDALDLVAQLRQAQWSMQTCGVVRPCDLFGEACAAAEAFVGRIAERIAALDGIPDGRLQTSASETALPRYQIDTTDGAVLVKGAARSLARFGALVRSSVEHTSILGDADTSVILARISSDSDQCLLLVEAHLASDVARVA